MLRVAWEAHVCMYICMCMYICVCAAWVKSRFLALSTWNTGFILIVWFIKYCVIFHANNYEPTFAPTLYVKLIITFLPVASTLQLMAFHIEWCVNSFVRIAMFPIGRKSFTLMSTSVWMKWKEQLTFSPRPRH